jgi:hypothetical protein
MPYAPDWFAKDQVIRMNQIMRDYQRTWGETVLYFEYDAMSSTKHDVYDEGPSRVWYPPFMLPVMFLDFRQDDPQDTQSGFYVSSTASICFQVTEAMDRFKTSPLYTAADFRDRFSYDNFVYGVTKYEKQGFVHGTYLTVSVLGQQIKAEEVANDMQNQDFFTQKLVY